MKNKNFSAKQCLENQTKIGEISNFLKHFRENFKSGRKILLKLQKKEVGYTI